MYVHIYTGGFPQDTRDLDDGNVGSGAGPVYIIPEVHTSKQIYICGKKDRYTDMYM